MENKSFKYKINSNIGILDGILVESKQDNKVYYNLEIDTKSNYKIVIPLKEPKVKDFKVSMESKLNPVNFIEYHNMDM